MNTYNKLVVIILLASIPVGCTSIPNKVPKLIEVSANAVDNQSAVSVAEWEESIAAANSAKKLLVLINSYVSTTDQSRISEEQKKSIENFSKGYPLVIKQIDKVIEQTEKPQKTLAKFEEITKAIRFANSYISKAVDENSRIEAMIDAITVLTKTGDKGE
jgi:hypothetical protein